MMLESTRCCPMLGINCVKQYACLILMIDNKTLFQNRVGKLSCHAMKMATQQVITQ